MSDAQSIELLSGHPDSDEFIEEYRRWRATESDVVGALILTEEAFYMKHRRGLAPKLAERVLTQPHAAQGKEKGKPPAGVNTSIGGPVIRKSAGGTWVFNETLCPGQELRPRQDLVL